MSALPQAIGAQVAFPGCQVVSLCAHQDYCARTQQKTPGSVARGRPTRPRRRHSRPVILFKRHARDPAMSNNARRWLCCPAACVALMACSCSAAPAFDIMGSLFPAWLACIAIGALLAAVTRWLLVHYRINLLFPLLTYPCLAAVFIFMIWLVVF